MGTKISDLTALTGTGIAVGDLLPVVDVSAGTSGTKKMTMAEFLNALGTANAAGTALTGANSATGDQFAIWDLDATATKYITRAELEIAIRNAAISATPVLAGSTLAVTQALHANRLVLFDQAAGSVCTLPAASGSGAVYKFATYVLATSNSHIVKVANSTDIMVGYSVSIDNADNSMTVFPTTSTSDTITLNRTTTGSVRIGEHIELQDIKTGFWAVKMCAVGTGGEATPFSATV